MLSGNANNIDKLVSKIFLQDFYTKYKLPRGWGGGARNVFVKTVSEEMAINSIMKY